MPKPQYYTPDATAILKNQKGYRDDTLFPPQPVPLPTDKHDPCDVVCTEILGCGKYEICDHLLLHEADRLSRFDVRLLVEITRRIKTELEPAVSPDERAQLRGIIRRLVGGRDYCVWLCAYPEQIYDYYLKEYIPKADRNQPGYAALCPAYDHKAALSREDYISQYVTAYQVPGDSVILCDLGIQGILVAMSHADT